MSLVSSCRRLTLVAIATAATMTATAGSAVAGDVAAGCPAAPTSNPFAPWGDAAAYQLVPGGDVEDGGASWSLAGGAAAVEGNETYMVAGADDHLSMRVPPAGSARTDEMCIGAEHPTFRFFVKRSGGTTFSRLLVEVVVNDRWGRSWSLPAGVVAGSAAWAPSATLPTLLGQIAQITGGTVDVSFRFRPQLGGTWSVDDVFVDPVKGT